MSAAWVARTVAVAGEHGNTWITREPRIDGREPAQIERRSPAACDDLDVCAVGAQAGVGLPGSVAIVHHADMFTSEAVTRGVRVRVESQYSPERSQPTNNQWFFLYSVTISNE